MVSRRSCLPALGVTLLLASLACGGAAARAQEVPPAAADAPAPADSGGPANAATSAGGTANAATSAGAPGPANAATSAGAPGPRSSWLRVEAPPGSLVEIDGGEARAAQTEGRTLQFPLSAGRHTFRVSLRGHMSRSDEVTLTPGEGRTVFAPLSPKTHGGAIRRSVLVPGWGSRYMERPVRGWLLTAAALGSVAGAIVLDAEMQDRTDDYDAKYESYLAAVTPEDVAARWAESEEAYDSVEDARKTRDTFLIALAGTYAISIVEAVFFCPFPVAESAAIERSSLGAPGGSAGFRVTLLRVPLPRGAP